MAFFIFQKTYFVVFLREKMKIEELRDKRILLLGFGREGRDTFAFLRKKFPKKIIGIADKSKNVGLAEDGKHSKFFLGKNYLNALDNYDVIIKSPGIPFNIFSKSSLKKIITQTDIFFANCPGTIVGITGTKGKSTTTSLIYQIIKTAEKRAYLIGNIGKPVLAYLAKAKSSDIFTYELSSHQLYGLKKSPHIAVLLNIFPEHLDYYKNISEYANAKANITLHQGKTDYLIYNKNDALVKKITKKSKAKKIAISGQYYDLDKNAARAVAKILKISATIAEKGIKNFKPLPHRLELVGTYKSISFYDDALSTIPETCIFAIKALGKNVQTVILGGYDRNISFKNLAKEIIGNKNIKNLIFFPTTGKKIWEEIKKIGKNLNLNPFFVDNMNDAVKIAYKNTSKGKICLLSTASTSFSIFKDYREKGNLFKKFVKSYGRQKS
jgi:UDP-N-acetylmuramoyl-L-alanine---L-glutamate ligase